MNMSEGHKRQSHEHRSDLAGEYRWGDSGQLLFVVVFIAGMLLDIFLLNISDSWQHTVPWYVRIVLFLPVFFMAGYFIQKAHKKVFEEERKKLMVINTDVYARLRHPMYFGSLLVYVSFVILSLSVIAAVIFVVVVLFYYYICRYEERLLVEKLGNEYKEYMKHVPMLFPKLKT